MPAVLWSKVTLALSVMSPVRVAVVPCRVPALTVVAPVRLLVPERTSVPRPLLVRSPAPPRAPESSGRHPG